ncbi:MAG: CRISPR-associated endonuclease Cas1 [Nautiliaceae bacterium]
MNRVIIDKAGRLEIKNFQLLFDERKIPLRKIDFLILSGDVELTTKVIAKLTRNDISVLIFNKGFSFIHPISSKNAELKKKQFFALNKRVEIAKWIVKEKIKRNFLGIEFDFTKIEKCESIDEVLGIEGAFARRYFKEYFSLFDKNLTKGYRSKRPPQDVVNALMSFLYTIVYYEITNILIKNGLDAQIGYLHEPFRTHNALSSDILELFRSEIDKFVLKLFKDKKIIKKDFTTQYRLRDEKRKELWKEIKNFLESLKIQKEISHLKGLL